jgi:hypothetical protein
MHHYFLPDFLSISKFMPLIQDLYAIFQLPYKKAEQSLSALISSMERKVIFNKLWLSGLNEKIQNINAHRQYRRHSDLGNVNATPPLVQSPSFQVPPQPEDGVRAEEISRSNIPVPGRLVATNLAIYFQYFNNIDPKAYVKYEYKHIKNIIKRRYLLRQV